MPRGNLVYTRPRKMNPYDQYVDLSKISKRIYKSVNPAVKDIQKTIEEYKPKPLDEMLNVDKKYPRNWSDYIKGRQKEKLWALNLLSEAIRILKVKTYGKGNGRPPYPLPDKIFFCVQKVMRRTTYDANEEFIDYSHLKKWVMCKPRPHSVADFMNDFQLTPILEQLIVLTSTPLAEFEKAYAIDSTGLSTFNRDRWIKVRLEHKQHKDYKKIHTIIGTRTCVIVSAKVTVGSQGDSPLLIPLLKNISRFFKLDTLSADGAYASRKNAQAVEDKGAVPYFKLRKDVSALSKGYPAWNRMFHRLRDDKEKYGRFYHSRSLIETSYSMFKRKISAFLSSKTEVAQTNESLCIAISHNLFCLVNAIFCDNLTPIFRG